MKRLNFLLVTISLLLSFSMKAQDIDCGIRVVELGLISENIPDTVCYGSYLEFVAGKSLTPNQHYQYSWANDQFFNDIFSTSNRTKVQFNDKRTVYARIISDTQDTCVSSVTVAIHPPFDITFIQTRLTCSNKDKDNGKSARVRVEASSPHYSSFTYEWDEGIITDPDDNQTAIGLSAYTEYGVTITNNIGCSQYFTFRPKAYGNPDIVITTSPSDTLFIGDPVGTFSFENLSDSIEVINHYWQFMNNPDKQTYDEETSEENMPSYSFKCSSNNPYRVNLIATNQYGCDTTFHHDIRVLPVRLKIPNIFTPNGDGANDTFIITLDETTTSKNFSTQDYRPLNDYFESSKVTIFNRWGNVVYSSSNYQNDWDGGKLRDGNYFYVVECSGFRDEINQEGASECDCYHTTYRYQGSVMIFGSGR